MSAADRGRARASSSSTRAAETRPLLLHSLMVVLNKLLSLERRYHLHAAAAAVGGVTSLFVGAKGSGK